MSRYLKAPRCHWPQCRRDMFLLSESEAFWMFQCECGCSRALTKPAQRAASLYTKYQNDLDQQRRLTRYLEAKKEFSFPGGK
jgi:hypothetical protein